MHLSSSKLKKPLRIGVLSDLQTDHVGNYERQALQTILDNKPDIILLPGDYIQVMPPARWEEMKALHDTLEEMKFQAQNGTYAVRGNVDDNTWPSIFAGLPIKTFEHNDDVPAREDVVVRGLSFDDSFDTHEKIDADPAHYLIAFGHAPDFSLGDAHADLLVAGHTHGGQVQIPAFGPLITFSKVPKEWAEGGTFAVRDGTTLVLTCGVGMERFYAPRMRFLCKPEVVIIDVRAEAKKP